MSADVLFTNGDDFTFQDKWVNADDSVELVKQQMVIGLRMARTDWFLNLKAGVNHVAFLTQKRVNVNAYAFSCAQDGISKENPYVDILSASATQKDRTVTVSLEGILIDRPFRLVAESPTSVTPIFGDNAHVAAFSYIFFTG